jgi:hypothetical protein
MVAQPQSLISKNKAVAIRRVTQDDAAVCGSIGFEAFATLANKHNFPPDFPTPEHAAHVLSMMFSHPSSFCVGSRWILLGTACPAHSKRPRSRYHEEKCLESDD